MDKQISLVDFAERFSSEEKCIAHLEAIRWPNGLRCLQCGAERVSRYTTTGKTGKERHLYVCLDCKHQFSVTVGTVMHDSHVPLTKWFLAIRLMCSAKKSISAKQLERELAVSYETAWYMAHRIRVAMKDEMHVLKGIVEVDETFIGGKARNRHISKRGKGGGTGGIGSGKIPVVGAVQRNGKVVARVVENVRAATLTGFIREAVSDKVSLLVTDEWTGYSRLSQEYPHEVINRSQGEYVVGANHTDTIEGFWSLFKRGIVGSFHKVSRKYLPLYVAEFEFPYNARHEQATMFDTVLRTCG
jgi:transposase-like protein